ncbi:hypothetical protein I203_102240 [Kwoniella mangroviensis CBS 8507]|uniref:uncharacterized protein n=1 Tax=Kwoniella mangroviensis CBS 8507 TaxID=1296122 RepID=UPI00080D3648|nr:uncharacterized protein I203_03437 [Kwoniella mangroviensis CBS 8507]OCF67739.1 hypothetical protein I203_03437 [Kwoniella mangroviensis CBS 8507]
MVPTAVALLLFSLTIPFLTSATPLRPIKRQGLFPPSSDNSTSENNQPTSGNDSGGGGGIALEIIIPIIVILVAAIICVGLVHFRSKLPKLFRSLTFSLPSSSTAAHQPISTRDSLPRTVTADQLSGTNTPLTGGNASSINNGSTPTTNITAAERRARRARERERNVRRTESGRSVKTLPVYSKEAGDEELVLVRQRSQSSFSSGSYSDEELHPEEGPEGDVEGGLLPSHRRSTSMRSNRTVRDHEDVDNRDNGLSPVGETHEEIGPDTRTPSLSPSDQHQPLPETPSPETPQRSELLVRRESLARRSWGLTPTYLEAMSAPLVYASSDPTTANQDVPPPRNLRTRTSSTFRGLLSRAGFTQNAPPPSSAQMMEIRNDRNRTRNGESSTSLLLQPTTSRASSSFAFGRSRSPSTASTPWESTNSLLISSPLPNTAMRASFDSTTLPRAGLSEDQMKFLASKEAINVVGKKIDDVPEYKRRRRSRTRGEGLSVDEGVGGRRRASSASSDVRLDDGEGEGDRLPSWEMSENTRRNQEAYERRNLNRPPSGEIEDESLDPLEKADQAERGTENDQRWLGTTMNHNENEHEPNGPIDENHEIDLPNDSTLNTSRNNDFENTQILKQKPIPAPIKVGQPDDNHDEIEDSASPNTFMTAPRTPLTPALTPTATARTNTLTSATTPRLEVEPPTPVASTPPPSLTR